MIEESDTPTMAKIIQAGMESRLCEVHTSMPGEVLSYDRTKQMCSVQPSFKRKYADGRIVTLPVIQNVPVIFPRSGATAIIWDLVAGDSVQLMFAERSMDRWSQSGGSVSPDDPRKHHLTDAVAIPGLYPRSKPAIPKGAPGSIELQNGDAWIEITKDKKFKVTNGTEELIDLLVKVCEELEKATTNTVFGAMKLNNFSAFVTLKQKLTKLKG